MPQLQKCCTDRLTRVLTVPHTRTPAGTRALLEAVDAGGDEFGVPELRALEADFSKVAGSDGGALNRAQFCSVRTRAL